MNNFQSPRLNSATFWVGNLRAQFSFESQVGFDTFVILQQNHW